MFDKFHIVRHLMAALDQVRRDEIRQKGPQHKALMHKTRFIWLKNPWNLTERQAHRLGELERLNLKINRAYLLKELFRHFWEYRRGGWAKRYLKKWFWWATHSRLEPMRDFAWMLRRHEEGILQLLSRADRQRHGRRAQQQGEARHSQGVRIPHRQATSVISTTV